MKQIRFRLGHPDGELTALPSDPLAGFKGPISWEGQEGREVKGME